MSKLLRKPKSVDNKDVKSKYELLNLIENPFPVTPFVNKVSPDNRYNGSIYESSIREKEKERLISNFICQPQADPNHIRLGYILDNSYVGRGNGKSAFALNIINAINNEFCLDISGEVNKCFGLHITPEPSGGTKTFSTFTDLIFESLIDKRIIDYCLATLRLEAIIEEYGEFDIDAEFNDDDDLVEKLNNPDWFKEKSYEIAKITNSIYKHEGFNKISIQFPLVRDRNMFVGNRLITQDDFKKYYFEILKKGKERINFVFNDLVLFMESAGFNGAYLIVDDFERIPDFQSEKLKQEFALELRTNLFDGILENARIGFYNFILVLHAGVPRLMEKAWAISGMNRRSPMMIEEGVPSNHIINFDKLNVDHAKLLIEIYLDQYRLDKHKSSGISPFTDEAVEIISEKAELNASSILEKAHMLIEYAVKECVSEIDKAFVDKIIGKSTDLSVDDDIISNEVSQDLFNKSKKRK